MTGEVSTGRVRGGYVGWLAAAIVLVITFSVAASVWFLFHH